MTETTARYVDATYDVEAVRDHLSALASSIQEDLQAEREELRRSKVKEAWAFLSVDAPASVLLERYRKDAVRLRSEVERGESKLGNAAFVAKAAPDIVAKEREKLEGYRNELARVLPEGHVQIEAPSSSPPPSEEQTQ